ncbi:hypothetical protein DNTS_031312 [Danionella cerebrum]|uniref:Solute carrier family 25 member 48 n=1 Tax=Danionella cerebrum TaxID=2873325 RepID=A0A553PVR0_9TELE|nr:hypothetical protein DNTS_031312 [Danionella translucida]
MTVFHVDDFIAGWIGGASSVVVGHPLDTVKTRLQAGKGYRNTLHCVLTIYKKENNFNLAGSGNGNGNVPMRSMGIQSQSLYRGPLHCISTVLQIEGLQGLYRGMGAMILRDVPGYTLYFIPYTLFCNWLNPDGNSSPNPCCIWLAGGLAGSISWVTATPADVVKSRLQADAMQQRKYKGILHCIVESYRTEGLHVFFRGATVNAVRGFPMCATMFLGYELSLQFFRSL